MRKIYARSNKNNIQATENIRHMRKDGHTFSTIAERLNQLGYTTRRNKSFYPMTVQRLFERR